MLIKKDLFKARQSLLTMNVLTELAAFTPLAQFFLLYLWDYRYSPGSIARNTREKDDWEWVLKQLTGLDYKVKKGEHLYIAIILAGFGISLAIDLAGLKLLFKILAQFIPALYFLLIVRYYAGPPPTSFMSYHIKNRRGPLLKYLGMVERSRRSM